MTAHGNSPRPFRADLVESINVIGRADDSAEQFAAALSAEPDDLAAFVRRLTGGQLSGHLDDFVARRSELVPILFGVARSVAGALTKLQLEITDEGPDLAIERGSGVALLQLRGLAE